MNRFAVATGKKVSVYTNNDDGWQTAKDLRSKGVKYVAVIDSRSISPVMPIQGAEIFMGTDVVDTKAEGHLNQLSSQMAKLSIPIHWLFLAAGILTYI